MIRYWCIVLGGAILFAFLFIAAAGAQVLFFDDFEDGARPEWGNEFGDWIAVDGVYTATIQTNDPPTYSSITSLPELTDFVVEVDVNGVRDGGVFLRSQRCENGLIDGVILVIGGYTGTYDGFYWHTGDCDGFSPPLNQVEVPGMQGSDIHLRIVVAGNQYRAYLDWGLDPVTTLTSDSHTSGRVALYEYVDQTYDNVRVTELTTWIESGQPSLLTGLQSIYPNPFNPSTTISFRLDRTQKVDIAVFGLSGHLLATLTSREYSVGSHAVTWNGRDALDRPQPSGSYLIRLETTDGIQASKVMLLK